MRPTIVSTLTLSLLTALGTTHLDAQTVVSRFDGSVEKGIYEADFDAFMYAAGGGAEPSLERVEGAIVSRVLAKPEAKTNLELFRSYQQELEAAGFTVHLAATPGGTTQRLIRTLYRSPNIALSDRSYRNTEDQVGGADLDRLATFGDYYLTASRTQGGESLYVGVLLCRDNNLYLIDELTTAAMETGTVSLNLDLMRSEIEETGKIAVYDIHFATGSAAIEAESADALTVIASYLEEIGGSFYIVGHTDDTGPLEGNITLSDARAAAVKEALVNEYGVASTRLEPSGVGPLAPVSNNTGEPGRALNRRVEIVQRLGGN